jgi:hypothetical protein
MDNGNAIVFVGLFFLSAGVEEEEEDTDTEAQSIRLSFPSREGAHFFWGFAPESEQIIHTVISTSKFIQVQPW